MPRSAEQLERVREESRERIVTAALRLFARHGYATTSVRAVAQEAGVSQGLMYNYFESKPALLRAIFERSLEEVRASLAEAGRGADGGERLERLVRSAFWTVRENADFWRLSYQVRMQPDVLAELGGAVRGWSESVLREIEALLEGGGGAEPGPRARALFAAIDGAAQHYVLDPEAYPLDAVAAEIVALVRAPAPRRGHPRSREETR